MTADCNSCNFGLLDSTYMKRVCVCVYVCNKRMELDMWNLIVPLNSSIIYFNWIFFKSKNV